MKFRQIEGRVKINRMGSAIQSSVRLSNSVAVHFYVGLGVCNEYVRIRIFGKIIFRFGKM